MTTALGRLRWTVGLAAAVLALGFAAAQGWWTWGLTDMFAFKPPYADTVAILAAGEARHAGADIYAIPNPYDPLGRPHVYGPGWLLTGTLGLTTHDAVWLGPLLAVLFTLTAALLLRPGGWREAGMGLLLLCSPPVMLGISRGNNDLFIFLLLAAAAVLLVEPRRFAAAAGCAAVALAAVLKLYPFAALPAIALAAKRRSVGIVRFGVTLAVCLLVVWSERADFQQAMHLAPDPRTTMAYGVKVLALTWADLAGMRTVVSLGWGVGLLLPLLTLLPCRKALWRAVTGDALTRVAFVLGASCWLFCFIAVRSFPYRFVLLILPARFWLERSEGTQAAAGRRQLFWWLIVAWFDPVKMAWAARARLDPTMHSTDWTVFEAIIGVEQGITLVLSAALLVTVASTVLQTLRREPEVAPAPAG